MTINVAIKCPEGVVMGADSLVTIATDTGSVASTIPYYSKLFKIESPGDPKKGYAAGAMLNGFGEVGERTVEDILEEFGENYPNMQQQDNYSLQQLATDLGKEIQKIIDIDLKGKNPMLEIIIGGFSRGEKAGGRRNGEIYSLFWSYLPCRLRIIYGKDTEFGTYYGGQPKIIDRFQYGMDDNMILRMMHRRENLFNQARDYILNELRKNGVAIPDSMTTISVPKQLKEFDIYSLISDYAIGKTPGENVKNIKEGSMGKLETMEKFLSLQAAVNYCTFLMSCSYAENAFTYVIPTVGSEMRIASVTRDEGFKFRKIWEIQTPSSPFR
jgi:hypothetical protein